jgi:hypothetical protein
MAGDGDLDDCSPSRVLLNAGDGTFPTSIELPGTSAYSIAAADMDGDGMLDVLLWNYGGPSRLLPNQMLSAWHGTQSLWQRMRPMPRYLLTPR